MKLGILGGTFNPIHLGHLRSAEEVAEDLNLRKVYLIPSGTPPHKNSCPVADFSHRLEMVKLAAMLSPLLEALDIEGKRPGLSYSIETLRFFRSHFGQEAKLYFIIGMDAFSEIKSWMECRNLFSYASFIVINRPGYDTSKFSRFVASIEAGFQWNALRKCFCHPSGNMLMRTNTTQMDISASLIREKVAQNRSIRFLVPDNVRDYIERTGLYHINDST